MTSITIPADKTIKALLAAIIVLGGVVWGDLHFQSTKATEAANLAAFDSLKLIGEIKNAIVVQDSRIDSLEKIVYGIGPRQGSGNPGHFRGRTPDRHGGPLSVPHKTPEPKEPEAKKPGAPAPTEKREPPDSEILETDG